MVSNIRNITIFIVVFFIATFKAKTQNLKAHKTLLNTIGLKIGKTNKKKFLYYKCTAFTTQEIDNKTEKEYSEVFINKAPRGYTYLLKNHTSKTTVLATNNYLLVVNNKQKTYFKTDTSNKAFSRLRIRYFGEVDLPFLMGTSIYNIYMDSSIYEGISVIDKKNCYTIHSYRDYGLKVEFIYQIDTLTNFPVRITDIHSFDIKEYSFKIVKEFKDVSFDSINEKLFIEATYTKGLKEILPPEVSIQKEEMPKSDSLISKTMPLTNGQSLFTNEKIGDDYFKNKILLLDFWFINCYPCAKVNEILKKLHQKYKDRGVEIISVNSIDKKEAILKHLKKYKTTHTNLLTKDAVDKAYQVESYPTVFCIDKTGIIKYILHGAAEDAEAQLEAFILTELAKKK
jgi:thiol-disulfide isomerase/thioredoxin